MWPLVTKKDVKLIWDDDYEQPFLPLKKALVQPPLLAHSTRDSHFVLSTYASDFSAYQAKNIMQLRKSYCYAI